MIVRASLGLALLTIVAGQQPAVAAELYKCAVDGRVLYQDQPCVSPGATRATIEVPDTPEQAQEKRAVAERARRKADEQRRALEREQRRKELDAAIAAERVADASPERKRWREAGMRLRNAKPGEPLSDGAFDARDVRTVRTPAGENRFADYCLPLGFGSSTSIVSIHTLNGVIVSVSDHKRSCDR